MPNLVALSLFLLQVVDVIIHAGTNQIEPIRVASNLVLIAWVLLGSRRTLGYAALGGYVALNAVFLAEAGITNGDDLRVTLLLLVVVSTILSIALLLQKRPPSKK